MLNATCRYEEPLYMTVLHYVSNAFSLPVYGTAFYVLLFKCPIRFHHYRNYLVAHIISGVLLELHLGTFWRLDVILPWPILCSNGLAAQFSVVCFQVFIILLVYTGVSAISLLVHRMRVATEFCVESAFCRAVFYMRRALYLSIVSVIILLVIIYSDLKEQKEYKLKMEQKWGRFPTHFWCENCYFMQFDSHTFLMFFFSGYLTIALAAATGISAAIVAARALFSSTVAFSLRTLKVQKNFLYSLLITVIIHISLILIPFAVYLICNFVALPKPLNSIFIFMLKEHGAFSTFALLLTNTVLRKAITDLFRKSLTQ